MIPRKFEPYLFGLVLSGLMSFVVAGISTLRNVGVVEGFTGLWVGAWLTAWLLAFPIVLFVAPLARRVVQRVLAPQ
ncbi:MAG: DUF2798 domain-containing protein [Rhizobacter sp.]|nr:DUF2798 domain-containing protein [Rhizobacter sp.]